MSGTAVPARIPIESDEAVRDVDRHFRVFAGPGAGKTHWLALHIREVLRRSERLQPAARVACVSYTNVAVSQIMERIGDAAFRVEGATIHAFLYRNVVRPYLHLLKDEAGAALVRHELVDGHDEHRPSFPTVDEWHRDVGKHFLADKGKAYAYLKALHWVREPKSGDWSLKLLSPREPVPLLPTTHLRAYKPVYWRRGIIDHDDVLYFAYRILEENPALRGFLAARFPYVFIDEFQDTNPVQTQIVRWLAAEGATVGVIGDVAQSIYGFQGARPADFRAFDLPDMDDYEIVGNRRSVDSIVRLLNAARGDGLNQICVRGEPGEPVMVYVGGAEAMYRAVQEWLGDDKELVALAHRNDEVRQIRDPAAVAKVELWGELSEATDFDRSLFIERVIRAGEIAFQGSFAAGVREMISAFRLRSGKFREPVRYAKTASELDRRGVAVSALEWLATEREHLRAGTLLDAYEGLSMHLRIALPGMSLKGVSSGAFKDFASATSYASLADSVRSAEESRHVRTIHQAKGEEFDHVLVCLADEARLVEFLTAAAPGREEHRVCYVAASRARDGLFFCVPALTQRVRSQLMAMGIRTVGNEVEVPAESIPRQ